MDIYNDELTISKMLAEYEKMLGAKKKIGTIHTLGRDMASDESANSCLVGLNNHCSFGALLLLLYFAGKLGYNFGYGTQIHDTVGSMGRLESNTDSTGNCHYFFRDDRQFF